MVGGTNPTPGRISLQLMVRGIDPTPRRSPKSIDVGDRVDQERCIPISQLMDIPMAAVVQQTRDKRVAACTWYSGDDLDIKAIHPSQ